MSIAAKPRSTQASLLTRIFLLALTLLFCQPALLQAGPEPDTPQSVRLAKRYRLAKAFYHNTASRPYSASQRSAWLKSGRYFRTIHTDDTNRDLAIDALFMLGTVYEDLFRHSQNALDLKAASYFYGELATGHPDHELADNSLYALGNLFLDSKNDAVQARRLFDRITSSYPDSDTAPLALEKLAKLADTPPKPSIAVALADIVAIRHDFTDGRARVVIESSQPTTFQSHILPAARTEPARLYIDLAGTMGFSIPETTIADNPLLHQIRSGQYDTDTVRIVLDTRGFDDYLVSSLDNPFRVIVDLWADRKHDTKRSATIIPETTEAVLSPPLKIIIDPGHGGRDPGTMNSAGLKEKDIVLQIAQALATVLRSHPNYHVFLTRHDDRFLTLDERTDFANRMQGDLFLSIHVNSHASANVHGIETYFLSLATNGEELQAAAKENAASADQLSELQAIIQDLVQNSKVTESARLAEAVQDALINGLSKKYSGIRSLGVKKAPFVVLIGAQMPAVLTEIAFLSNTIEASRLQNSVYLNEMANLLANGIDRFANILRPEGPPPQPVIYALDAKRRQVQALP